MINSSLETCFSGTQQLGQLKNSCFIIAQNQKVKANQFFSKELYPNGAKNF